MTSVQRDVLLVRLANELEDHLDLGILYTGDAERRRQYMRTHLSLCVEMAAWLGAPELAEALTATFEEVAAAEMPAGLQRPEDGSFRVPPPRTAPARPREPLHRPMAPALSAGSGTRRCGHGMPVCGGRAATLAMIVVSSPGSTGLGTCML